jgi:hypothetical protein
MTTESIELWHKRARPAPTQKNFNTQLGCHFEEFGEMMDAMEADDAPEWRALKRDIMLMAKRLKANEVDVTITYRQEVIDSLGDQVVTAVGVGHCANMRTAEAIARVNESNWTKYDKDGNPIFDANGKIMKGPDYKPPQLEGLY